MSETQHCKFKLIPTGLTPEEYSAKNNLEVDDYFENAQEALEDHFYEKVAVIENQVYEVTDMKDMQYDDVFESNKNEDGSIDIHVKYYNGGCGFSEAIEYALEEDKDATNP
jgi:hypothetical protein